MEPEDTKLPNFFRIHPQCEPRYVVRFVTWLVAWADPGLRDGHECLHDAGSRMLHWLAKDICGMTLKRITSVEIIHGCDDDANDRNVILINRKHRLELLSARGNRQPNRNPLTRNSPPENSTYIHVENPPYYQDSTTPPNTGCSDRLVRYDPEYVDISCGFSLADLHGFTLFRDDGEAIHPLVTEFRRHLSDVIRTQERFRTEPPAGWDDPAWTGFFTALCDAAFASENHPNEMSCHFVSDHWEFHCKGLENATLTLTRDKLAISFVVNTDIAKIMWNRIEEHDAGLVEAFEYELEGQYQYMLPRDNVFVLKYRNDYRQFGGNGLIDLAATIRHLQSLASLFAGSIPGAYTGCGDGWLENSRPGPCWTILWILKFLDPKHLRKRPRLHRLAVALWDEFHRDSPTLRPDIHNKYDIVCVRLGCLHAWNGMNFTVEEVILKPFNKDQISAQNPMYPRFTDRYCAIDVESPACYRSSLVSYTRIQSLVSRINPTKDIFAIWSRAMRMNCKDKAKRIDVVSEISNYLIRMELNMGHPVPRKPLGEPLDFTMRLLKHAHRKFKLINDNEYEAIKLAIEESRERMRELFKSPHDSFPMRCSHPDLLAESLGTL